MKIPKIIAALLALAPATASAGGSEGSIGVGMELMNAGSGLLGLGAGGASVNYDAGMFHAGGFLAFYDDEDAPGADDNAFAIGGRFYYHVHSTAMSDFSVGGALGLVHSSNPDPIEDEDDFVIDLGAQIRAFITANVALSFSVGFGLVTADGDEIALDGQPNALAGVHYYFF